MKKTFLIPLLLGGCMVGPDFVKPDTDISKEWHNKGYMNTSCLSQKDIAWWHSFRDEDLNTLIEEAIDSNLSIQLSLERIRQARAAVSLTTGNLFPNSFGGGSYNHSHSSANGSRSNLSASGSGGGQSSDLYTLGFDATWELDIFGGLRRAREASIATFESVVEDGRAVLITKIAEIAQNYLNMRNSQQQIHLLTEQVNLWNQYVNLKQNLLRSGLTNAIDLSTAQTSLAQAQAQIPIFQEALKSQMHQLALLLGKEPGYLYERFSVFKPLHIPSTTDMISIGIPVNLIEQRPDIREAERVLAAKTATVGVSVAALFPSVNLIGNYGVESISSSNLLTKASQVWSYTPGFTIPLLDFGRLKAQIDQNKSLMEQSLIGYKLTILTALGDVETSLVNFREEDNRSRSLKKAYEASLLGSKLTEDLYNTGLNPLLDVYQAKINAIIAQQSYSISETTRGINLISLYKALGGGWDTTPIFQNQDPSSNFVVSSGVSYAVEGIKNHTS